MSQLHEMAKPFPQRYMGKDDRGNDAVDHTVVTQRLLQIVGPYDLQVVEVLRSDVEGMKTKSGKVHPGGHFVTGVVLRLTVEIDGKRVSVEEVGGCENAAMKDGEGERMKHAMSDAIKRAAMRLGLGLHMWAQENFFLYDELGKSGETAPAAVPEEATPTTPQPSAAGEEPRSGDESGPAPLPAWVVPLIIQYGTETTLKAVNSVRSDKGLEPIPDLYSLAALDVKVATQKLISGRLSDSDWAPPKQGALT